MFNNDKIDKPLTKLITEKNKERRHKLPISDMKRDVTTDSIDIKRVIGNYYEQFYDNTFNKLSII